MSISHIEPFSFSRWEGRTDRLQPRCGWPPGHTAWPLRPGCGAGAACTGLPPTRPSPGPLRSNQASSGHCRASWRHCHHRPPPGCGATDAGVACQPGTARSGLRGKCLSGQRLLRQHVQPLPRKNILNAAIASSSFVFIFFSLLFFFRTDFTKKFKPGTCHKSLKISRK